MDTKVYKRPPRKVNVKENLRVAAYTRVSSGKDAMLHSLSEQISYYSGYIQAHEGWEYAGVYIDKALTGTKDTRKEFRRLIDDCKAGKIDMIITKSLSRFARNTVTLLRTIRDMKKIGVAIYFETERKNTLDLKNEYLITLLAQSAEAMAKNTSERCMSTIRDKFALGLPTGYTIYGYDKKNNDFRIREDEAAVVKEIFSMYLDGLGARRIANELQARGIPSPKGGEWSKGTIMQMLRNEKYIGELLLQKTFTLDPISKKEVINRGEREQVHIRGNHTPIVDKEVFDKVQEVIAAKEELHPHIAPYDYRFKGIVHCGTCGDRYYRKKTGTGSNYERFIWRCRIYNEKGKKCCDSKQITDKILCGLADEFNKEIEKIVILPDNKVKFLFADGSEAVREWKIDRSWSDEMKERNYHQLRKRYAN